MLENVSDRRPATANAVERIGERIAPTASVHATSATQKNNNRQYALSVPAELKKICLVITSRESGEGSVFD
jgi:hypothetical protein